VRLEYLHPREVYAAVVEDEADLGVVSYPRSHPGLTVLPWIREEMVLVCTPTHQLARARDVRVRDLDGRSFVTFDRDLKIRGEIDRMLKRRHVRVRVISEFDNIETIKQALEIDSAVSILPRPSVERDVRRGNLVVVRLTDLKLERPLGILRRRKARLTPTAEAFLQILQASQADSVGPQPSRVDSPRCRDGKGG
jgi:DNA-binding transcriptional LysR family regulator